MSERKAVYLLTTMFCMLLSVGSAQTSVADVNRKALDLLSSDPDSAFQLLRENLSLTQRQKNLKEHGVCCNHLGVYYQNLDSFARAQHFFFRALKSYPESCLLERASTLNNIANTYQRSGHGSTAIDFYRRAQKMYVDLQNRRGIVFTANNIGIVYAAAGEPGEALKAYNLALQYAGNQLDSLNIGEVMLNKGAAFLDMERYDSAEVYFRLSDTYFRQENNWLALATLGNNLGYLYYLTDNFEKAFESYYRALSISSRRQLPSARLSAIEGLHDLHNYLGNSDSVSHYFNEWITQKEQLFREKTHSDLLELEARYQNEKNRKNLENERERSVLLNERNARQSWLIWTLSVALILLLVILVFVERLHRQKKHIRELAAEQDRLRMDRLLKERESDELQARMHGEQEERKRIASELHDRVGGLLATIHLQLQVTDEAAGVGEPLRETLAETIREVRNISHNLAGIGSHESFEEVLENWRHSVEQSGKLQVELHIDLPVGIPRNETAEELLKVIRELAANTIKHAEATQITLQLAIVDEELQLIFEDNGKGFDPANVRGGLGMQSMRGRVEKMGGKLWIDSYAGHGTTIILSIPFKK